jgi:amidohydrolase
MKEGPESPIVEDSMPLRAELSALRRHLHAHPELSGEERQTAALVAQRLAAMGLEPVVGGHGAETGVVALVTGGAGAGPTYAWRADMDALPIHEETGAPYSSTCAGVMHACGHDVHTAVGLGIAAELVRRRGELRGSVKMIFQPSEEGVPGAGIVGAEAMARGGVLEDPPVAGIFALHCMPSLEVGTIGVRPGAMWAGSDGWTLRIVGRQTHGAYPHEGIDPVYIAGHVIVAMQGLVGRRVDSRDSAVISVGRVSADGSFNIIPGEARLVGLVRTLSSEVREVLLGEFRTLVEGICAAHGARAELTISQGAIVTANAPPLVEAARQALAGAPVTLVEPRPQLGAEDFASFSTRVPGCFFVLGTSTPGTENAPGLHSPLFDVDEACMPLAVDTFSDMLINVARGPQ